MGNKKDGKKSAASKAKKEPKSHKPGKRQNLSEGGDDPDGSRKRPKRAAACTDFKEKPVQISEEACLVESKKDQLVEDEIVAIGLTAGSSEDRANRRLMDFILHDSNGTPQPLEMLEVNDMFISGLILPLEESVDKQRERVVRCEGFGRVESWNISGYEDGSPVIWLSTDIADYDCRKPAISYKKFYDIFFEKARVCVEVYKRLSKPFGGNPDCSLDELLAQVARSLSGSKFFSNGAAVKNFVISQGEFIYHQLIGLDETSKNDQLFMESSVLVALRDESLKHDNFKQAKVAFSGGNLTIGPNIVDGESKTEQSGSSTCSAQEDEDAKLAKLLQEEEVYKSRKSRKTQASVSGPKKFYIKINEDEIANDYPLPAYYKSSNEEVDELIVFDNDFDVCLSDELPRSKLDNWALYNSDTRLMSLELLPMRPCADIDVTIFGSGTMTDDDGSGFCLDTDPSQSSSGSSSAHVAGMPIFLSAIKEWMIEFGSSMIFISVRTDMAW